MKLRPYQVEAASRLARGDAVGLIMSAGLGKTLTILSAWERRQEFPVLVVTKAIGRHVWDRDALKLWDGQQRFSCLWAGSKRSKSGQHKDGTFSSLASSLEHSQLVVTNYEILEKRYAELRHIPWRYLIFDESHALKGGYLPILKRRDGSIKKRRFDHAHELARLVHRDRGTVWGLTATPVRDRVRDYWGQLAVVAPCEFPLRGKYDFLKRYCDGHQEEYGFVSTGATNQEELFAKIDRLFVRLTREIVRDQLPAIQRDIRCVPPSEALDYKLFGGNVENAIARTAAVKESTAVELALEYLSDSSRVVLVTSRRKTAASLAQALNTAMRSASKSLHREARERAILRHVNGETPIKQRVKVAEEVNTYPGPAALVATMDSITESIDLHHMDGLVVASLPYTPYQLVQLEGRVGRLGGVPSTIHYLIAEGTIDEKIRETLLDKLQAVEEVGADTQGAGGAAQSLRGIKDDREVLDQLRAWLEERT